MPSACGCPTPRLPCDGWACDHRFAKAKNSVNCLDRVASIAARRPEATLNEISRITFFKSVAVRLSPCSSRAKGPLSASSWPATVGYWSCGYLALRSKNWRPIFDQRLARLGGIVAVRPGLEAMFAAVLAKLRIVLRLAEALRRRWYLPLPSAPATD